MFPQGVFQPSNFSLLASFIVVTPQQLLVLPELYRPGHGPRNLLRHVFMTKQIGTDFRKSFVPRITVAGFSFSDRYLALMPTVTAPWLG